MPKKPSLKNTYTQSFAQMTEISDQMITEASSGIITRTIDFDNLKESAGLPDSLNSTAVFGGPEDLRYGHIELPVPVVNIHYLRGKMPFLAAKLGMDLSTVTKIVYASLFVVTSSTDEEWPLGMTMEEKKTHEVPDGVEVLTQAGAIEKLLQAKGKSTDCIILHNIPVLPGFLRYKQKDEKFTISDLELLTSRVLRRAKRLECLIAMNAPNIIILNEKRVLQEMCDDLIYNGCRGIPYSDDYGRPYQCFYDLYEAITRKPRLDISHAYDAIKKVDKETLANCLSKYDELEAHYAGLPDDFDYDSDTEGDELLRKILAEMDTIFHEAVSEIISHYYPGYTDHREALERYAGFAYHKLDKNCKEMLTDKTLDFIAEGILLQMEIFIKRCSMWA